ncbi:MAG: rod shape-determining protein MreD [Microcoleaceae cyanobacterium]
MYRILNWSITVTSLVICALLSLVTLPGTNLFGISPNWLLIWLVVWSTRHTLIESAIAGMVIGLMLDGMTAANPTHLFTYVLAGVVTVLLHRRIVKKVQENFISVAFIVFGMVMLVEALQALQVLGFRGAEQTISMADFWLYQQRMALGSAIVSSLWAPVLYFPLNRWWEFFRTYRRRLHYLG